MQADTPFWELKPLREMDAREWEALCDGCGQCCVFKVEDDETGEIFLSNVACPLLDKATCRCMDYEHRREVIPDCAKLTPRNIRRLSTLLPTSCAYRLLAEGHGLPDWHPLVTGDPESTAAAGMSARNRLIALEEAGEIEDHIAAGALDDDVPVET